MKLQDLLLPLLFAIAGVWLMNYFFPRQRVVQEAGQRVALPQEPVEVGPLNKEVDFADKPGSKTVQTTEVVTKHGRLVFSTAAASLQNVMFQRTVDGKVIDLTTLTPPTEVEREKSFFLVALNEKTPYFYTLEERRDNERTVELLYRAHSSEASVSKKYTVYKDVYQVDLELTVKPHRSVQPRIFFGAPILLGLSQNSSTGSSVSEQTAGVVEESNAVVKYARSRYVRELNDNFWKQPSLFGAEDRYFVNAMVADADKFTRRGYYKVEGERIYPILEGPTIEKETSWKLSFYVGPKEQAAMAAVDPRLDAVLDFGWLAPISKLMLWIMLWMNSYLNSFGLVIVLIAILIRLLLIPLSWGATDRGQKMSEMNKKMVYLKQKYKDNPEQLRIEREELYKKYGIAGMGLTGCLPMLLQIPIFFAINRVLSSSIDLYQAPFLWVSDLSAKDPYYILPILTGISMFYFSMVQSGGAQQRITGALTAVFFAAIATGFSAGLALYIFLSTALGALQTVIQKKLS